MQLSFQIEEFAPAIEELKPLSQCHWEEIGRDRERVPLSVDWERYSRIEASGNLIFATARDAEQHLIGYMIALASYHLHYGTTRFAQIDVFWVAPEHRRGTNGVKLFQLFEREARRRGVVKIIGQTKLDDAHDLSSLYKYLGWTPQEMLFTKVL